MKRIYILVFAVVSSFTTYCQTRLLEADRCFANGDYTCAETKYKEVIKWGSGKDRQIAEIKLDRTKRCADTIKAADQAFANKNYKSAKDLYESVLENNPNDPNAKLQIKKCKEALFIATKLPSKISGPMQRCSGDSRLETYTLEGALLGSEAKYWRLLEEDKEIRRFTKDTIKLAPSRSTKYRIYADNDLEKFVDFEITVHDKPVISGLIVTKHQVCVGEQFSLQLDGEVQIQNVTLNWYKTDKAATMRKFVSSGKQILDVAQDGATYEVEASYQGCIGENKLVKTVNIYPIPAQPQIEKLVFTGSSSQKAEISLSPQEAEDMQYEWSTDAFSTKTTTTKNLISVPLKKGANTVYIKAINHCGTNSSTTEYLINRPRTGYFFMNIGAVTNDVKKVETFMVTLGVKRIYVRIKMNPNMLANEGNYSTNFSNSKLEITNSGKVINFPPSTGYYYVVNDQMENNRQAATIGTSFGGKKLRIYLGGGYGERTNLWGIDLRSYSDNVYTGNVRAKNINQSWKGPEGEAGLFLKLGHFNVMGGAGAIFDSNQDNPFIDFHLGIGFSTR
jgi:hypothetical protein